MKTSIKVLFLIASSVWLAACGGEPTFDGTNDETAAASLQSMFPDLDLADKSQSPPPAIGTFYCYSLRSAFAGVEIDGKKVGGFGSNNDEENELVNRHIMDTFDGMTAEDMLAFGEKEGIDPNCMDSLKQLAR